MTTSLAQQLAKLAVPQTALLQRGKKRASLLFDPKEAATLTRETVYLIGKEGFEELLLLNQAFQKFSDTLFSDKSKNMERAIQTSAFNVELNKNMQQFLSLLSPYFLQRCTHKALEWLVHRFHIQEYNIDELIFLALPYHETNIFVRILQIIKIKSDDKWLWLRPLQKPGVHLPKSTLYTHAASDVNFLKLMCDYVLKTLKLNNYSNVNTLIAFYCTTFIGAIDSSKEITDSHITLMMPAIMRGLTSSKNSDFCSATHMIIAQLIAKTPLSQRLLTVFTQNITLFKIPSLKIESILLLIIIYQHQNDYNEISEKAFLNIANNEWFVNVLQELMNTGSRVQDLLTVLIAKGLEMVRTENNGEKAREFVKRLVNLKIDMMVPDLIRSILSVCHPNYNRPEVLSFFVDLIKTLEIQYPNQFDDTINNIMSSTMVDLQDKFRLLIRGKLNSVEWCEMLEKLNHPVASIRQESVDMLIKNYEHYSVRSHDFFKSMIFNRLHDENVDVIHQCLISDKNLVSKVIDRQILVEVLNELLLKCLEFRETHWKLVIPALNMLMPLLSNENYESLIVILCFFKPKNSDEMETVHFIMDDRTGTASFLDIVRQNIGKYEHFEKYLEKDIVAELSGVNKGNLLNIEKILAVVNEKSVLNKYSMFTSTLLRVLVYLMRENTSVDISTIILERLISQNPSKKPDYFQIANREEFPLDNYLNFLERIIENTNIRETTKEQAENVILIDLSEAASSSRKYIVHLIDVLTKGLFYKKKYVCSYAATLKVFLDQLSANLTGKVILLLNIACADSEFISKDLKMRCLLVVQSIISNRRSDVEIQEIIVVMLFVLLNKSTEYRSLQITFDIITQLTVGTNKFTDYLKELLQYRGEILLDNNQLSQIMPYISNLKEAYQGISDQVTDFVCEEKNKIPLYIQATYFDATIGQANKENIAKTSKIACQILKSTSNALTKTQSQLICNNINRLTPEIAKNIQIGSGDVWLFIETTLFNDKNIIFTSKEAKSPSVLIMSIINTDFYANLKTSAQNQLLDFIITIATKSDNPEVLSSAAKVFKHIDLVSSTIIPILTKMRDLQSHKVNSRQKRRVSVIPSVDLLSTEPWRKGVCVLELILDKKKFDKTINLIPILFDLLKKCLDFDEQSNVEYPKQLILSSILHCCVRNTSEAGVPQFSESVFNMSLIVQCMRSSWNPQTHQNTLLLLAQCATFSPNQVLQNIMAIFTFMGSSYLRHDDAYSFQIITRIIDTIIPILIKDDTLEQTLSVLEVFVDAITDVPEHRRIPLYHQFLTKLNSELHVNYFLLLVFRNHVKHANAEKLKASKNPLAKMQITNRLDILASLCEEFDVKTILTIVDHVLEYLRELPVEKDDSKPDVIITMKSCTIKEFRHYKYTIIQFVANLLSSQNVVTKVASLSTENLMALESVYKNLIIHTLTYIQLTTKVSENNSKTPQAQYWKVIVHHSYDILDSVNALLTPRMFLLVIKGLLTHSLPTVRRRALELLNVKLQHKEDFFEDYKDAQFNDLIVSLMNIIKTIAYDKGKDEEVEQDIIVQTALLSLKLIIRLNAEKQPKKYVQLLSLITELIKCKALNVNILASLILCLAELCNQLKMHSISNLTNFMPVVIKTLKSQRNADAPNLLLLSTITAIHKMMDCISLFLTPYLEKIICELTCLTSQWKNMQQDSAKGAPIFNKINLIWGKISATIEPRVLIPIVEASYNSLIEKKRLANIEPLMDLLAKNMEHYKKVVLESHVLELTTFFLSALQFRSSHKNIEESAIVERHVMKVFVVLILKLSERSFRPLFYKLYDWALRCDDKSERAITFYNLTKEISTNLKGLFVLFAGHFLNNSAAILDQCNTIKTEQLYYENEQQNVLLLENVLATLKNVFEHDTQKFVNKERFDVLMQSLVDQLENALGGVEALKTRSKGILIPAIVHFAVATRDDSLWKQLNYQICLKMRNADAAIRIIAVECLREMVKMIGDDFLPLLPETIPFLAELLEDEVEDVEKVTQKSIQEMEGILGEPLQKYF